MNIVPFTVVLMLVAGAAQAQTKPQANDQEVRQVGPKTWPTPQTAQERARQSNKDKAKEAKKEAGKAEAKPDTNAIVKATSNPLALKTQDEIKKDAQPATEAATTPTQQPAANAAQPNSQPNAPANSAQPSPTQASPQPAAPTNAQASGQPTQPNGFASIRLGTDVNGRVVISEDQQRQIKRAVRNARPVETQVKVGETVPAGIALGAVSSDLVEVLPQFRGYTYFATREEILIVDSRDRKVAATIPVKTGAVATRPPDAKPSVTTTTGSAGARDSERNVTRPREARPQPLRNQDRQARDLSNVQDAIERDMQARRTQGSSGQRLGVIEPGESTVIMRRIPD